MPIKITMTGTVGSVQPSNGDVEAVAEAVGNASLTAIQTQELDPKLQQLQAAASAFLEKYNEYVSLLNDLENGYKSIQNAHKSIATDANTQQGASPAIKRYEEALDKTKEKLRKKKVGQEVYSAVFDFQVALNKYFGYQGMLTIVEEGEGTGRVFTTPITDYSNFLTYKYKKDGIHASFQSFTTLVQNLNMSEWTDIKHLQALDYDLNAIDKVLHARDSAITRFNISKGVLGTTHKGLVLWHRPNWVGMWVNGGQGDIQEAYASIILDREATNSFTSGDINELLDLFMWTYVGNVDSTSGMLRGDYSDIQNGLEYAIKSSDADALGYKQFVDIAHHIIDDHYNTAQLEDWKEKNIKSKGKRNFKADLSEIETKKLAEIITNLNGAGVS